MGKKVWFAVLMENVMKLETGRVLLTRGCGLCPSVFTVDRARAGLGGGGGLIPLQQSFC
jgi:hypothetical protein